MKTTPRLEMHQVYGRIGIRRHDATLEIEQKKAVQSIQQPKAVMNIQREPARVLIDQTEAWHNLDLKSARVRITEAAQAGRQAIFEGIARRASEGDELMHIERGGNPIAEQAIRHGTQDHHYDTGHVPSSEAVKISGDAGKLKIDWKTHAPKIDVELNPPRFTSEPGLVQIFMEQYPSLSFEAKGLYVDEKG
ncbi:hypothetical protein GMB86_05970 [Terrilactibacillus sp. BCM23-1]|uniref:Uncharacterized protein n=1 Tax=Terrilactibacillus tamarindi TaxID=2599694 RepID=A0A6N8CNL0_9BACI|nr:DUF6470 family protein [Terrilactibacillus tamarindi]MTT31561.1 hypothetical protein [Terrilactibacillus tamarindi]